MRRFAWVAATFAILIAAAAVALAWRGQQIAATALRMALDRAGIPASAVEVRSLGWRGVAIGPLRLGGADGPSATGVALDWSLGGLLAGEADRVRIAGLRLRLAMEDGRFRVQGMPNLGSGSGGSLPLRQIELTDARVTVAAGGGSGTARIDAMLEREGTLLHGSATVDAAWGAPAEQVALRLPRLGLDPQAMRLAIAGGDLRLPERKVALSQIEIDANTDGIRLTGKLHDMAAPAAWPALDIEVEGKMASDRIVATARASGGGLKLTGTARHDRPSGRGQAELALAPLQFAPGRQPADLIPAVGRQLAQVTGSIAAQAQARWDARGVTTSASLHLDRLGFDSDTVQARDLSGRIALAPAWPPRAVEPQHITGTVGFAGLPPGRLSLAVTLPADGQLRIATAELGLAGGTLALADTLLARGRPLATRLIVRGLDIDAVLRLVDIDGLSGTGRIDGVIPVEVANGGVAIRDGKLAATGPGSLRYVGDKLPETIAGLQGEAGEAVRLARQALTDFRYTGLELTLDRAADGQGALLARIAGSNPQVLDNHPFVFNIRLDTNFDRLALLLLDGYAAAEGLLRHAARP